MDAQEEDGSTALGVQCDIYPGGEQKLAAAYLWLARNEGMDPCISPYITYYSSSQFAFQP